MKKNIAAAIVTFGMYLINRRVRTVAGGAVGYFLRCYFNDIAGSVTFMSLVNIVLLFLGFREITRLLHTEMLMLGAGIIWEYVTPLFRSDTVSDPFDILAYMLGGFIYRVIVQKMQDTAYSDFTKK